MNQVAVYLIVNQEGKVLVEKRGIDEVKVLSGHFLFPGGGVREGETLEEALIRELEEELGIRALNYQKLEEEILGITGKVTLKPFLITSWEGEIPEKILDEEDNLSWVELDFMLNSPLEPTRKIALALQNYLNSKK